MKYLVRASDCAASIAARFGVSIDDLLDLGDNARLSADGRDPHILRPGESIDVPEEPSRSASFSSGGTKRFKVTIPKTPLRLQLVGRGGDKLANKRYELVVSGATIPGTTDGDGWVDASVSAIANAATLRVWMQDGDAHPIEEHVQLGAVDPIEEESGVVHRLGNLGFGIAEHGAQGLASAIASFQRVAGLPVTGRLDADTRDRLKERHGS